MNSRLFEPVTIGALKLKNRLVMAPMVTQYGDESGFVTQRMIDFYVERAKHNIGLVIVEAAYIAPGGKSTSKQLGIYNDSFILGLSKLADCIKKAGAPCVLQITHIGRRGNSKTNNSILPVAPSVIPQRNGELPRELTLPEITDLSEAFASGARRAKEAGFDGIELHCTHGYLIAQFLSPLTNKRTDKYGGDSLSRARFAIETVERIRREVGKGYPVIARITGEECISGGLNLRDTQKIVMLLEKAGVNAIHVSAGYIASHEEGYFNAHFPWLIPPMSLPHGCYLHLAKGIKKAAKTQIIAVGRLDDIELAEAAIAEGKADLIAVGRGFLADAAFASKVYHHQYNDIRRCIACNNCIVNLQPEGNLTCTVNPELGREAEYRIEPTRTPKSVLVIGGGPGGMEAARIAALRGHKVALAEKKPYLGGNLVPAASVSFKRGINHLIEYLSNAILKSGVTVYLNTEVNPENALDFKPDVVILATGALPQMPAIPGIGLDSVVDAIGVLEGTVDTGRRVIVVGAGMIGCEVAVCLAEHNKEVTIVSRRDTDFSDTGGLSPDMEPALRRWFLFDLWPDLPIDVVGKSTFQEVTAEGLIVEDREGKRRLISGDTIVFALGMKPNQKLKVGLQNIVLELYEVGDCVQPRKIRDATREAARVARLI